ncbi:MAG: CHASE3 domain-containing protein [Propionivibrio sp.]|nr:CHASE3 domain-containing protein [Propionivibrio sp.]
MAIGNKDAGRSEGSFLVKATHKTLAGFVAALLLVALGVVLSLWTFRQIEEAAAVRKHTFAVITDANRFLSALTDAETGQRGYLLTGDESFLDRYMANRDRLSGRLQDLRHLTLLPAAQKHLDAVAPLTEAKLAEMSQSIELRRQQGMPAALALVRSGQGKSLMDSIRSEMLGFIETEENLLAQREAEFQSEMRRMFSLIVAATLLALLFAIAFAWLIHRQTQQRFKDLLHLETRNLLEIQEGMNRQLQQANIALGDREEKLAVTLDSIGDAVIATDAEARVTLLNPVAEQLTGWTQAQAVGLPVGEVFHIVNQKTREPATLPVIETLAQGTIQGMANHTILIARDGRECDIADSCAPIRERNGQVVGAVLVFRNVSDDYALQHALEVQQVELEMQNEELIQSQAALETSRLRYFDLYDLSPVGYCTLSESAANSGLILEANLTAATLLGVARGTLVGQAFTRFISREGADTFYLLRKKLGETGAAPPCELQMVRQDGTPFWVRLEATATQDDSGSVTRIVISDISSRKQVEEALYKAGALQRAIFNSANFSSIATDASGVIQIFNVGAERMLGYAAIDVVNKITPADISDPQEVIERAQALSVELERPIAPGFEALVFKASRGIEDIYELTCIRKDGSRFPALVSVTALRDAQNSIIGYLLIGTDNTARKRVEAERARLDQVLQDKNVELERARIVAEKANLAKSEFLSSMSHELRTPLGAILGFAQLIESGTPLPTPSQNKSIAQILKAGWYLLELINEILDLAQIESGKLSLSMEPVALSEVLSECEAMIEPQAKTRGIRLAFEHFEMPCFVQADRTRVKQVLINLLSNAIKYNKVDGSVSVTGTLIDPDLIRISVRDSGAGLSAEQLAQLFIPFNRLGQEEKDTEGTGIGLVVSKRLIEWMGGKIGVESTLGEGTVFWIELNLIPEPQVLAPPDETLVPEHLLPEGAAPLRTLLYVEDNPANLMLVEDLVARRPDILLLSAPDGYRGIKIARDTVPDVILMDINLPGISGLQALKILAEDPATAHIPVIALSANAIPRDIEKGLEAGFFRYLTKPIKVAEFMSTLDVALQFATTERNNAANKEPAC